MRKTIFNLLNIIFPKYCLSCNAEGSVFCEDCLSLITVNTKALLFEQTYPLRGLFYAASYEDPRVRLAVRSFKYPPFIKDLAPSLAFLIISHLALADKPSHMNASFTADRAGDSVLLSTVPLHKKRLKWRGFDHTKAIAEHVARSLQLPYDPDLLLKERATSPQVELDGDARSENIKNAFSVSDPAFVRDKTIFLLDDVYTTGATMQECARVLREAGAKTVWGIAVARG